MRNPDLTNLNQFRAICFALVTFCLIVSIGNTHPAFADADAELLKLRKALTASSERQEEISGRLHLLSNEIKALKEKSVKVGRRLINIDLKMIETEDRLNDIRQVEEQTLKTLAKQNEGLADTLSALLQLSRQPEGSLIGSPENLINSLRTATLLKAAVAALKKDADDLSEQLDTLASLRDQFIAEQTSFQSLKKSRLSEQDSLNSLLASKKSAQTTLSGLNTKEEREQKKLSSEARDLVALINGLELRKRERLKEERLRIEREIARQEKLRRKDALRRVAEAKELARKGALERPEQIARIAIPTPTPSRKKSKSSESKQAPKSETRLATLNTRRSFSSAKGTLALPVGGRIISKYSKSGDARRRNGIVIETRGNAAVVSPYDGQIAFAGPFRHYGLLLIIDHGEGYHTLLAGMGSIEGSVGQLLLAGEPVGQMKNSDAKKPTLYMELRVKGSPVNPVPWLAAGNRKVSG